MCMAYGVTKTKCIIKPLAKSKETHTNYSIPFCIMAKLNQNAFASNIEIVSQTHWH